MLKQFFLGGRGKIKIQKLWNGKSFGFRWIRIKQECFIYPMDVLYRLTFDLGILLGEKVISGHCGDLYGGSGGGHLEEPSCREKQQQQQQQQHVYRGPPHTMLASDTDKSGKQKRHRTRWIQHPPLRHWVLYLTRIWVGIQIMTTVNL